MYRLRTPIVLALTTLKIHCLPNTLVLFAAMTLIVGGCTATTQRDQADPQDAAAEARKQSEYTAEDLGVVRKSPQTNGICERFHKTILQEFYQVTFRKKLYGDLESLQTDLDTWIDYYNNERTHQGKMCCGRTPIETLEDGKEIWREKLIA